MEELQFFSSDINRRVSVIFMTVTFKPFSDINRGVSVIFMTVTFKPFSDINGKLIVRFPYQIVIF